MPQHLGLPFQLALLTGSFLLGQLLLTLVSVQTVDPFWIWTFCGISAALISWRIHNPPWWHLIHALFFPLLYVTLLFGAPAWIGALIFLLLLLTSWGALTDRVPLFLSNHQVNQSVLDFMHQNNINILIDLGSGIGSSVLYCARKDPSLTTIGIEHAPLSYAISRLRSYGLKNNTFVYQNFWNTKVSDYSKHSPVIVYTFLSPQPMARLWEHLKTQLPPGSVLISHQFAIPNLAPDQVIECAPSSDTLFVYHIPKRH